MTFRARLLQAILGVVVLTTATSLYFAERQIRTSYRTMVDTLFRQQTAAFQREQENLHARAADQAQRLATSVRLFAALEARDSEVYKIASDELRLGDFEAFRLLDVHGEMVTPPADGRAGSLDTANLHPQFAPGHGIPGDAVALGFVHDARMPSARTVLYRVLATPIVNFELQVGTLILAQPMTRFSADESPPNELRAALWIDGELVGGTLSAAVRDALTAYLAQSATAAAVGEIDVAGTAHRYERVLLNPGSPYPPAWLVSVFSMAEFETQQHALVLRLVLTGVAVAFVAAVVGLALSRQLARPIGELVDATRQILRGDYDLTVRSAATREMRTLAEAFRAMASGLALKDRYHSLLAQVADPQVAAELVAGRIRLGGELREVTVMFCDIREYTVLTIGRAPEDVIDLLNDHLGTMARVVHAHGGVVNQFAGDAIMALFGAPKSYGDDAVRAVRCAIAMIRERERMNTVAALPIHIGIGIASGTMVAGCIGAENRSDYTVVGERVNLAARLSSAAPAGEILLDASTCACLAADIATTAVAPMMLKGFAEPVTAHRVTGVGEAA